MRTKVHGYRCSPRLYEYNGWFFEYKYMMGPHPLCEDGEPFKRAGDKFYDMWNEFNKLPNKEDYRVGGGCEEF